MEPRIRFHGMNSWVPQTFKNKGTGGDRKGQEGGVGGKGGLRGGRGDRGGVTTSVLEFGVHMFTRCSKRFKITHFTAYLLGWVPGGVCNVYIP